MLNDAHSRADAPHTGLDVRLSIRAAGPPHGIGTRLVGTQENEEDDGVEADDRGFERGVRTEAAYHGPRKVVADRIS